MGNDADEKIARNEEDYESTRGGTEADETLRVEDGLSLQFVGVPSCRDSSDFEAIEVISHVTPSCFAIDRLGGMA